MTQRVLFNGVVLVRPGGATKIDASAFEGVSIAGIGVVALVGEADAGEPNVINIFSNAGAMKKYFRSGPLANMSGLAFRATGDPRIGAGASSVVAIKVNQAVAATATLQGRGVANATLTGTGLFPFSLLASGALKLDVNGVIEVGAGAVFTGNQASMTGSAGTFAAAASETMTIKMGLTGLVQTITFGAEASVAEYAATINDQLSGGSCTVFGGQLKAFCDIKGSSSKIEILTLSGTLAAKTGLSVSAAVSVGSNVANLAAVTYAEFASIVGAAYTGITITGGGAGQGATLTSNLSGAGSSIQVQSGTVQAALVLPTTLFESTSATNVMVLTALQYGTMGNLIAYKVADSAGGKVLTISQLDGTTQRTETSPVLGAVAKLSVQYAGASAASLLTVNATGLTTSCTNPAENLSCPFTQYASIQDLANFINMQAGYTATVLALNPYADLSANLDYVTGADIKAAAVSLFGKLMDVINWVNQNSALVSATRVVNGPSAPVAVGPLPLAGGARGNSTNSNWQTGFNQLGTVRVNQVAPLIAYDLTADGLGSTATVDAVNAQCDAHCSYYSSTGGKSERQAFLSKYGDKATIKAAAQILNSPDSCLVGVQNPTILGEDGSLTKYPAYAQAVAAASMRAGAELGEPLTYKFIKFFGLETHASWSPALDAAEMILAGVMFAEQVAGQGFRFVKGITTYTRSDNDAYTEESVVQGWKNVAYELRTVLENTYTGRRANPATIQGIKQTAANKLDVLKREGQIVDSVLTDGTRLNAWRNLVVATVPGKPDTVAISVTVSPVSGINFTLNTVTLVPAQLSA
jgi:hypothetical protein